MVFKEAHKILRTEKLAVVPELQPFYDGQYIDVGGETCTADEMRLHVQMP